MSDEAPFIHIPSAIYSGDDIEIEFTGRAVQNDYGVPGSPTWISYEDPQIESLTILNVSVDPTVLPEPLQAAFRELSVELDWA